MSAVAETRPRVTINSDMGEGLGLHTFGNDDSLLSVVDAINVACGFHAGDPDVMDATVAAAVAADVAVGAHPGLPDLVGFGRRRMLLRPEEVESILLYQVGALTAFLNRHGGTLSHLKPHGALYGMLAGDEAQMTAAARVARQFGVPFFGLPGTQHQLVCEREGVEFVGELYVDLNYDAQGNLIIQRRPESADPAEAADRVRSALTTGRIRAVDGTELPVSFDSICVHSDSATAPAVAAAVREVLSQH